MKVRQMLGTFLFVISTSAAASTGCDFVLGPSKVAHGELYQSGDARYDGYFASIHQEQASAKQWPDDAKASRRAIVTALALSANASNGQILSALRSKHGDASVGAAVAQTTASEQDRARRLNATATRLDELRKHGEDLKTETENDRKNLGAAKADEKKTAKRREVEREMSAAVDAVESLAAKARHDASDAEELATKLKAAWTGKPDDERPAAKAEEKREPKAEKKKPAAPPPASPAPKPAPTGEVFNP